MGSTVDDAIIGLLERNGDEFHGTFDLALELNSPGWWARLRARCLQEQGQITIIRSQGGRGRKTVYKRNRNSPGQPRVKP